jgi:hypothetical protein
MVKKILAWGSGVAGAVTALAVPFLSHAQVISAGALTIPSSTANDFLASVSNIFSDNGVLAIVVIAAAIPLFFYAVRQLIGLLPKGRARS